MRGIPHANLTSESGKKLEEVLQTRFGVGLEGAVIHQNPTTLQILQRRSSDPRLSAVKKAEYDQLIALLQKGENLTSQEVDDLLDLNQRLLVGVLGRKKKKKIPTLVHTTPLVEPARPAPHTAPAAPLPTPNTPPPVPVAPNTGASMLPPGAAAELSPEIKQLFIDWEYAFHTYDELWKLSDVETMRAFSLFGKLSQKIQMAIEELEAQDSSDETQLCLFLMKQGCQNMERLAKERKNPRIFLYEITDEIEELLNHTWKVTKEMETEIRERLEELEPYYEGEDKDHCKEIQEKWAEIFEFSGMFSLKIKSLIKEGLKQDVIDALTQRFQDYSNHYIFALQHRYGKAFGIRPTEKERKNLQALLEKIEDNEKKFIKFTYGPDKKKDSNSS